MKSMSDYSAIYREKADLYDELVSAEDVDAHLPEALAAARNSVRAELASAGGLVVMDAAEVATTLSELGFSAAECSDDACLAEMGMFLGVEHVVTGTLNRRGGKFTLSMRLISVEQSATVRDVEEECLCAFTRAKGELSRNIVAGILGRRAPSARAGRPLRKPSRRADIRGRRRSTGRDS